MCRSTARRRDFVNLVSLIQILVGIQCVRAYIEVKHSVSTMIRKNYYFLRWLNSISRGRIRKCLYASASRIKVFVEACVPLEIDF